MSILDVHFPGPRPLRGAREGSGGEETGDLLIGRDDQLVRIQDACASRDVITLTAFSGVGKSSFISAGLLPALRASQRYQIFPKPIARPEHGGRLDEPGWTDILESIDDAPLDATPRQLAERAYRSIVGLPQDTGQRLLPDLRKHMAGSLRAVVVLDQYEELLRYNGAIGEALLRLVARVAPEVGAHIVIARSEYRERLRPVEEAIDVAVWTSTLPELGESTLPELFSKPFVLKGVEVDEAVGTLLREWWVKARKGAGAAQRGQVGAEGMADVGLLHFQAFAKAFTDWVRAEWPALNAAGFTEDRVTLDLVNRYAEQRAAASRHDAPGGWLFEDALVTWVRQKTGELMTEPLPRPTPRGTAQAPGAPLWWKQGPSLMTARVAPLFTVAGYKQPQALYSLLPHAIGEETSTNTAARLAEEIQRDSANAAELLRKASEKVGPAGIGLVDHHARETLLPEMVDSLHAALLYLSGPDINVFRKFERAGEPVFELVHDGMGTALKQWSTEYLSRPLADIAIIASQTAPYLRGRKISPEMIADQQRMSGYGLDVWGPVTLVEPPVATWPAQHLEIVGVSYPSGAFEDCVFENVTLRGCTFRGASFIGCTFRNVVFENCDLKALLFMLGTTLENVIFENGGGTADALDLLTIKEPPVADGIVFRHLEQSTGIFLQRLPAGSWSVEHSQVRHLVLSSSVPEGQPGPIVEFVDSDAFGVSTEGPVELIAEGGRVREITIEADAPS